MIFVNSVIQQYEKGNAKWSGFSKEPREKYTFTNPIKILNGLYICLLQPPKLIFNKVWQLCEIFTVYDFSSELTKRASASHLPSQFHFEGIGELPCQ